MWKAHPCSTLAEVGETATDYEVIGIDEGQFFPDIVTFSEQMANMGKIVIIAALDGTFQRKPFNNILELIPLAEDVTKLTAVCTYCQKDASFSKRIGKETEVEVIGGADKYVAVCRGCFYAEHLTPRKGESPTKFLSFQRTPEKYAGAKEVKRNIIF